MDDTCAVCAESLEWVAYGRCGHKDVCSTCVARLRFICNDRCCCICKSESTIIFVTKALGDYTKTITDFSVFPSENKEGRSGPYMYHEDTQSYFDDLDQYNMIKAMCRVSCRVCDKMDSKSKRKARFRDINQLKGHLFHQHQLIVCSLCLEGRKVFICEQKLYSKAQLKQHINTGDSEVDGTESERGGFQGHPLCDFCRTPFYGDYELYTHMNTEHYKCHICQRQNPGKYEYYKNYDDLEIHFRQEHFLCEEDSCLSKKFIVFPSESEMKMHNAQEHGGRLSRSKRNAVLQLPTSFTYRRSNEQDNRRGRRTTFLRDLSESELSRAMESSLETSNSNSGFLGASSSIGPVISNNNSINNTIPLIQPFEALTMDSDPPSRYLSVVSHRPRNTPLEETAFPPLVPTASAKKLNGLLRNSMADNLRKQNKKKVNVCSAWPVATRLNNSNNNSQPSSSSGSRPVNTSKTASLVLSGQRKSTTNPVLASTSISHSTSAPNLVDMGSVSDFPPVSTFQTRNGSVNEPGSGPTTKSVNEVYAANKSMVDKIRAGLDNDQEKYARFKDVSAQYRKGVIDAETYLVYVDQFGLSHLVLDLARLLPDPHKEKELIAVYNLNQTMNVPKGYNRKNKVKSVANNRILTTNYRPPDDEVETLSKDGYRAASKGKLKVNDDDRASPGGQVVNKLPKGEGGDGDVKSNQRKKMSKFLRVRLGNGYLASLDVNNSDGGSDGHWGKVESGEKADQESNGVVPVRGVWRNGGGHRLIVKDLKRP